MHPLLEEECDNVKEGPPQTRVLNLIGGMQPPGILLTLLLLYSSMQACQSQGLMA